MDVQVWTVFVLSHLSAVLQLSTSLTCWTRSCSDGSDWCHQECLEGEACLAIYTVNVSNNAIIPSETFSCAHTVPNRCLNTRCELTSIGGSALHHCCCREDLCNVVDGIDGSVTAPPQGTIATPPGTPPLPSNENIVCESFTEEEHIFKSCSICTATYKLIAGDEYQLDTKQCLDSPPTGTTCMDTCSLDTSGSGTEISCCCTSYLCNAYAELNFSDVTRVSDYVHLTPCDDSDCTHSCVIVEGSPVCFCDVGYALEVDRATCTDIDECLMAPCSQRCQNTVGSFRCLCSPGYRFGEDGVTCIESGLVCFDGSPSTTTVVTYCEDEMVDVIDVETHCKLIYGLQEDGTFKQLVSSCFSQDEACPITPSGACELTRITHRDDNLYECCCTTNLCNSEQNVIYPDTATTNPTSMAITTDVHVLPSPTLETSSPITTVQIGLIFIGTFVVVLITVLLCFIFAFWCLCKKKRVTQDITELDSIPIFASTAEEFTFINDIGRGRFAVVYYAKRRDSDVAVKCFDVKESFFKELSIYLIDHFQHENVLKFLTYVENAEAKKYWIVTEYHERGSLYSLLKQKSITLKEFCTLSESMACGLAYLHSEITRNGTTKPCVVHRDLKSKNILVKTDGQCAISDFGLSVKFPLSNQDGHGQVGTSRYMAPEVLEGCITFDRASYKQIDCYSVGIIFYEMLTRTNLNGEPIPDYQPPFSDKVPENPSIEDMKDLVATQGYRPPFPNSFIKDGSFDKLTELIMELWDNLGNARVTAEATSEKLKKFRLSKFAEEKASDSGYENEIPSTPSSSLLASPSPFTLKYPISSLLGYSTETTV